MEATIVSVLSIQIQENSSIRIASKEMYSQVLIPEVKITCFGCHYEVNFISYPVIHLKKLELVVVATF